MPHPWSNRRHLLRLCLLILAGVVWPAHAGLGLTELPATQDAGPITVFYPSQDAERPMVIGRGLDLSVARDGAVEGGKHLLVVISHGSGGSPWVHSDLARDLVEAGFVVAIPEHQGDNYRNPAHPGPDSWAKRPAEVSHAIDVLGGSPRFRGQLQLGRVGVYGMSAGGHTALSMAGGRWSRAGFMRHCDAQLANDFQACVGLATQLDGGMLDEVRLRLSRMLIDARFQDDTPQEHLDPRVAAVVAAVPFAADFDLASLQHPRVPLGLVTARQDRWLTPRFHAEQVLAVCTTCEHLLDTGGGHGSALSPLPTGFSGLEGALLNDLPGFDRKQATAAMDRAVTQFFLRHLMP